MAKPGSTSHAGLHMRQVSLVSKDQGPMFDGGEHRRRRPCVGAPRRLCSIYSAASSSSKPTAGDLQAQCQVVDGDGAADLAEPPPQPA